MTSPTLATVATQFLQRPGLASGTLNAYESTLLPLLTAYGSWPINLLERGEVVEYLQSLRACKQIRSWICDNKGADKPEEGSDVCYPRDSSMRL
jgi:hypothetical protein